MVKTSFLMDYPFDIVREALMDDSLKEKINPSTGDKKDLGKTKINDRITEHVTRNQFSLHIPFMADREMLLKQYMFYPYTKDDLLSFSTNTEHKDYPVQKNVVRCNVHFLASYCKKEGDKTRFYRLSHFNMEISMMNKFAGGSAAIKKTREFIENLKGACEEVKKRRGGK